MLASQKSTGFARGFSLLALKHVDGAVGWRRLRRVRARLDELTARINALHRSLHSRLVIEIADHFSKRIIQHEHDTEDAWREEAYDQMVREILESHREEIVDEFGSERMASYYRNNPDLAAGAESALAESRSLLSFSPTASLVFSRRLQKSHCAICS